MSNYITIDGGTTNTRIRLVQDNKVTAEARLSVGAKDCISGEKDYKSLMAAEIKTLLQDTKTAEKEVCAILASGIRVVRLHGEGPVRRRIMDMGITKGVEIYVRKVAPFGDPMEINVRGYELSLRKADADIIEVE